MSGLRCIALALFVASGCAGMSTTKATAVATIATVDSLEIGIDTFTQYAIKRDIGLREEAIVACRDRERRADFLACTDEIKARVRAPIAKAKLAIQVYREVLAAGAGSEALKKAAGEAVAALADNGIVVIGGR